ncbi:hypothetical protein [Halobaculum sp. D14]|uniref:hypothetical protein n=1 Tax=unclassified Halobaculum TaxID=2640896 RepID=UPI003EBFFF41
MSVQQRVPDSLVGPLGVLSLGVGVIGLVVGYIFVLVGITLYFDMNGLTGVSNTEALTVTASGIAAIVVGYLGGRGFMSFAY